MFHIFDLFNNSWKFPFNLAQILEFHRWANQRLKHSNFSFRLKRNSGFEFHERYFCVQSLGFLHSINCCLLLTESHHSNHILFCYLINFNLWLCVQCTLYTEKAKAKFTEQRMESIISATIEVFVHPHHRQHHRHQNQTLKTKQHTTILREKLIYENSIFIPPSIAANDNKLFNISRASQID